MIRRKISNMMKIWRNAGPGTAVLASMNLLTLTCNRVFLRNRYVIRKVNGYRMYLDAEDRGISRTLALFGTRERDQIFVLREELKEGMVVLDVGANIGSYALIEAGLVGNEGRVYAVEPAPENFHLLNRNIRLNGFENVITTFQLGISDKKGVEKLYLSDSCNLHTFYPGRPAQQEDGQCVEERTIDVETTTISDFAADKQDIDFIRMDIEGYEVEAFRGMLDILKTGDFSPTILFETHRPKYDETTHDMRGALQQLFKLGYRVKTLVSNDEPNMKIRKLGYRPERLIRSDFMLRGIYRKISQDDILYFVCDVGSVRAVLLEVEAVFDGDRV